MFSSLTFRASSRFPARVAGRWVAPLIVIALLVLALGGGAAITGYLVADRQDRAVKGTFARARMHVDLLQAEWTETVARIDALHRLARQVTLARLGGDRPTEQRLLGELRAALEISMPMTVEVGSTDSTGILLWSTIRLPPHPVDLSQTDYVHAIMHDNRDRFMAAQALGGLSQRQSMHFTRAMRGPDGQLVAITIVSMDASRINALAHGLDPRGRNFVAVVRHDGIVLAQSDGQSAGLDLSTKRPDIRGVLAQSDSQFRGVSVFDNIRRFFVGRAVAGTGTTVVVALDEAAMLAPARAEAAAMWRWNIAVDVCLIGLASLLLLLFHKERWARDERMRHTSYRAQETFLRQIADEAIDLIALLDHRHRFLYVNPTCRELIGVEPDAILGEPADIFVPPQQRSELRSVLGSLSAGGRPRRLMMPVVRRWDGLQRWMEIEASHLTLPPGPEGNPNGCFFIARDVTERKAAEDALQRAREDLDTVARAGPGSLYRVSITQDGTRHLLFATHAERSYLGFTEAETRKGDFFNAVLHPDDKPAYDAGIDALRRHGEATLEYRMQNRDGTFRWIRDVCVVTDSGDAALLVSGYCCDITREKEQAEQLGEARRLVSLGEMASGLAHELNQPLAAMILAAENGLLLLDKGPAAISLAQEKFCRITSLAERAAAIIAGMRAFGRANAPPPVPVDLTDTIHDALAVMHARLELEDIRVRLDLPPALPAVIGVPVLLQQVLINLIANACDAYRGKSALRNERQISIAAWSEDGIIRLEVADRAGGIDEAAIPRLFEAFFTTKTYGGTGMGLAVSFGIVRQFGGSIIARNGHGGAIFQVVLPVQAGTAAQPLLREAVAAGEFER
jgi:PAS domain S-box-containing protein